MPEVMVGGRVIHYLEWLDGKRAERPIVFIHGSGGNAAVWRKVMEGLAEEDCPSLAVDLPGHGGSPGEGMKSIKEYCQFISSFLEALGMNSVILGGHSMGGAVAQAFSLHSPGRLEAILLIGTGARLRVLPEALEMHRKMAFGETEPEFTPWAFSEKASPEIIEEGREEWAKTGPRARYYDFLACDQFDIMADLGKIQTPVLIACGREDRLTPVKYSEFLKEKIAGSKMEVIENSGHMVMLENPRDLCQAIARFLALLDCDAGKKPRHAEPLDL